LLAVFSCEKVRDVQAGRPDSGLRQYVEKITGGLLVDRKSSNRFSNANIDENESFASFETTV
jgi:hypothetical protein